MVVIVGLVVGVLLGLLLCFSSYRIRLFINNSDRIVEFIIRFSGLVSVFKKEDCFFVLCCVCLVLIMLSNFCWSVICILSWFLILFFICLCKVFSLLLIVLICLYKCLFLLRIVLIFFSEVVNCICSLLNCWVCFWFKWVIFCLILVWVWVKFCWLIKGDVGLIFFMLLLGLLSNLVNVLLFCLVCIWVFCLLILVI